PGMVAGLFAVHRDLGRLPIGEVFAPAIRLCREGIVMNAFQEYLFQVVGPIYVATEEARKVYGSPAHPGELVREGDRIRFPEMAAALEALAREGPDLFYRGEMAERLAAQCRSGGALGLDDLNNYQVERRKPLEFFYRDRRLLGNPPPSCGGILIAFCLQLLERSGIPPAAPQGEGDLIPLAGAMELTNKARIDALAQDEDWEGAAARLLDPEFLERYRAEILGRPSAVRGTTHLNVADAEGNIASMSLSNGEGCGHILRGTGIMLNNMLGEEDLSPRGFHRFALNRRMSSMMAPTLLFERDGTVVALGSGGSNRLRTAIVQVLRHLVDHRLSLRDAVNSPRIHFERGLLSVEAGFSAATVEALRKKFPELHLWENKNLFFGGVHSVAYHPGRG
ncbi:MAG: gamma-glutamyltransferase, partial [Candidatus Binatia bacterium]